MQEIPSANTSWQELLCSPPPAAHVLQLYDSERFLEKAVAHFAVEGLRKGEAVLMSATPRHFAGIRHAMESAGAEVDAALRRGQLICGDPQDQCSSVMSGRSLDADRFRALLEGSFERIAADGRFAGVRGWGEMTTLLMESDLREARLAAERLADVAAKKYGARLFCSSPCDRYDAQAYGEELNELCSLHSHVIPAEDYVRHRLAVNRAIAEVVGELKGSVLQSLASWRGLGCSLPSSQALLFWLREAMPERFEAVLERARAHHEK